MQKKKRKQKDKVNTGFKSTALTDAEDGGATSKYDITAMMEEFKDIDAYIQTNIDTNPIYGVDEYAQQVCSSGQ